MSKRPLLALVIMLALLLLSACGSSTDPQATAPAAGQTATNAGGNIQEYPLPQSASGVMRPAIDHQGRIWFGEMGHNYLAFFDPHTRRFQQMTPPHGASGIMGVVVAADDTIWFAEQYANYIGHYNPTTQQYQTYSLPRLTVPDPANKGGLLTLPSAPNDLALDAQDNVWFTELNADSLGMLDPRTGSIRQYPLGAHKSVQTLNPYGIAIDPKGLVWFTESSTNHLGRLDPHTGIIQTYNAPGSGITLMEVISDPHGTVWLTSFNTGQLLKFEPETATFTAFQAASPENSNGGLYGLTRTSDGTIWVTISQENAIARFDPASRQFVKYTIPTDNSLPFGIVAALDHTLWFTESGSNKLGVLQS